MSDTGSEYMQRKIHLLCLLVPYNGHSGLVEDRGCRLCIWREVEEAREEGMVRVADKKVWGHRSWGHWYREDLYSVQVCLPTKHCRESKSLKRTDFEK